jgi:hypothetical protein
MQKLKIFAFSIFLSGRSCVVDDVAVLGLDELGATVGRRSDGQGLGRFAGSELDEVGRLQQNDSSPLIFFIMYY